VFYSGKVPEKITLSDHGEKVLQTNCIRCHGTTVEKIDPARQCWQCHRWLQHSRAGIRLTN
jgi:cytochrome c nitrite reductase small subunit